MIDIRWGQPITFGSRGSAKTAIPVGLDFTEGDASWTTSEFCGFQFRLPASQRDVAVRLNISPYLLKDKVQRQEVWIYLNGLLASYNIVTAPTEISFTVPKPIVMARDVQLRLVIPTAAQPKALGVSADERRLGLLLREVAFAAG